MAEPHLTLAVTGSAAAALSISPMLIYFGVEPDVLVAGLVGSVLVMSWMRTINTFGRACSAGMFSALLAAYGSPSLTILIASKFSGITPDTQGLRMVVALMIGAAAPYLVPLIIKYLGNKVKS